MRNVFCLVAMLMVAWLAPTARAQLQKAEAEKRADSAKKKYEEALDKHNAAVQKHNELWKRIGDQDKRYKAVKDKMTALDKAIVESGLTLMDKVQAVEYEVIKIENVTNMVTDGPVVKKLKKAKTEMDAAVVQYNNGMYLKATLSFIGSFMESAGTLKMSDKSKEAMEKAIKNYSDLLVEETLKRYEMMESMEEVPPPL